MIRLIAALALGLVLWPTAARADALPMPVPVGEVQELLIGVWREEPGQPGWGRGHGFIERTVFFGNDTAVVTSFGGITYSNEYYATTIAGRWTATRTDDKTVKVTLTQSETRGTELTLTFDGENSFLLLDSEGPPNPTRFTRVGQKITVTR